jgi:hypothetical protein
MQGWCEVCRQIRWISLRSIGVPRIPLSSTLQVGICDECGRARA